MLKEADKRVVRSFVAERPADSRLLETDGIRLDKIGLGGETVAKWIGGRIAIVSTESAKSDESIIRLITQTAGPGVVDFSYARKGHRVHEHGAMGRNGRRSGVLSDGTRATVICSGRGDEWTCVLDSPTGEESELALRGTHGGRAGEQIPWDAVPPHIKSHIEQRATGESMVANARSKRTFSIGERVRQSEYSGLAGEVIAIGGADDYFVQQDNGDRFWWHEQDMEPEIIRQRATGESMVANSRGGHKPNGLSYSDAEAMGAQPDDYVLGVVNRDGEIGLYRVRSGSLFEIELSADLQTIASAAEIDARNRGTQDAVVFEDDGSGQLRQIGHVLRGRWEVEMRENGSNDRIVELIPSTVNNGWWQVRVDANVLQCDQKMLPYPTYIGVIKPNGKFDVWTPAASVPRGYRSAAKEVLEDITRLGTVDGHFDPPSRQFNIGAPLGYMPNARGTVADPVAARELSLYIENDYALIGAPNSIGKSIDTNLRKKIANGSYDSAHAPRAWQYLIDEGAKKYTGEFGSGSPIFNAATRRSVAHDFARAWEDENLNGAGGLPFHSDEEFAAARSARKTTR